MNAIILKIILTGSFYETDLGDWTHILFFPEENWKHDIISYYKIWNNAIIFLERHIQVVWLFVNII